VTAATGVTPVAVWGAAERGGWGRWHSWPRWLDAEKWAMDRGLCGGGLATYRIEFYLVDAPFARVYGFARNDDGHLFTDPATGRATLADPVTVMLDELPPAELTGPR
jgi:hypothetical protein